MVSEYQAKRYCCEDISKIENYDKAVADTTQTWHCHHRGEILPCGVFTKDDLMNYGLYYHRPAHELIFLTHSDHRKLHYSVCPISEKTKMKMSKSHTGLPSPNRGKPSPLRGIPKSKRESLETRLKKSISHIGCSDWFNNGIDELRGTDCPPGYVRGRLKRYWFNNGVEERFCSVCPEGWNKGRLWTFPSKVN